MNTQEKILIWWSENHPENKLGPQDAFSKFKEDTDYEGKQNTFSQHLNKLYKKKDLFEKPEYGKYKINEKGIKKAKSIKGEDEENELPEGLEDKIFELEEALEWKLDDLSSIGDVLHINISDLDKFNPELVKWFEENPEQFLDCLEDAVTGISSGLTEFEYRLVVDSDSYDEEIYKARDKDFLDEIVTLHGTIESASRTTLEIISAEFECNDCGAIYEKDQDSNTKIKSPYKCDCGHKKFNKINENAGNVIEFRLGNQEGHNEQIKGIFRTQNITERVNTVFSPGNDVKISGIIKKLPNKQSDELEPYLEVVSFSQESKMLDLEEVEEEKKKEIKAKVEVTDNPFEEFASSLCPEIVGQDAAKKVFAASLLGGSPRKEFGEVIEDGRIHSLILSNPGSGKSTIQEWIKETFPKGYYADGRNATGVALTASVEQEDGKWRLNAGKLVFAHQGILSLDEFDKMNENDADRLNTAMSSNTFPIDKAGINQELPGKATIIATGNFTDYLDEEEAAMSKMPKHAESLMDRFSLRYAMRSPDDNKKVEESILAGFSGENSSHLQSTFDKDELVIYRELARNIEPELTESAAKLIQDWIGGQKKIADSKGNSLAKTDSQRYLGDIAKLTTAFARSRLSEEATEKDAQKAMELFVDCQQSMGFSDGESAAEGVTA